jgi:integrase
MFTYAIRLGVVLDNVASALDQRKVESKQVKIPTQEQFEKLIKTMRKADPRSEPGCNLVELPAYSGMRLNEGVNLLWGMLILIEGAPKVTGGEKGTKNHEERTVPLFPAMRELLERIKGDSTPASREEIIPINDAKTMIRSACEKAELPYFTHHNMRHYFCSNAIEAGVNFKVIAGWLEHSDGGGRQDLRPSARHPQL